MKPMAKTKKANSRLNKPPWLAILIVALALSAAVYAMTTWHSNDQKSSASSINTSDTSGSSLKVNPQPSSAADVNNNPTPAQNAATTPGGQNMQPSAPTTPGTNYNNPYDYPPNPNPCPSGGREIACIQY
jgi:hypothetical protein